MNPSEVRPGAGPGQMTHRRCATVTAGDDNRQWLVCDDARGHSLVFASRRAAVRFAVFGTGRRPGGGAALMIPAVATKT